MASISPLSCSASFMKMIGPLDVTVFTTSVDRTTMNTEQKARQKWHLCRFKSLQECFMKKRRDWQQVISSVSSSSSYCRGVAFSLLHTSVSVSGLLTDKCADKLDEILADVCGVSP